MNSFRHLTGIYGRGINSPPETLYVQSIPTTRMEERRRDLFLDMDHRLGVRLTSSWFHKRRAISWLDERSLASQRLFHGPGQSIYVLPPSGRLHTLMQLHMKHVWYRTSRKSSVFHVVTSGEQGVWWSDATTHTHRSLPSHVPSYCFVLISYSVIGGTSLTEADLFNDFC